MKFNKTVKRVFSIALSLALAATSVVVPQAAKKADAATTYNAYLCLCTAKYTFRNNHDDSKFSTKLQNTSGGTLSSAASKAKFTNAKITKSGTYTVSL